MMFYKLLCNTTAQATSLLDSIPQLEDDIAAQGFLQSSFWTAANISILIAILLILGIGAVLLYKRYFKAKETPAPKADSIALLALEQLEAQNPAPRELSLQLSLILREYLTQETQEPALYETHQEFSSRINSLASVPANFQYDMRNLLDELSEMKYAPTLQSIQDKPIPRARKLIQGIAEEKLRLEEASKDLS